MRSRRIAFAGWNGMSPSSRISRRTTSIFTARWKIISRRRRSFSPDSAEQKAKTEATAVINIDDRYGAQLVDRLEKKVPVITYGVSARADFRASNYHAEFAGTSYQLDARGKSYLVRVPLIGRFNVANSMAALAAANSMGISLREAILSLGRSPQVPGRLEAVPAKRQFQVFVDYAHTDDALLNVLKTLRELSPAEADRRLRLRRRPGQTEAAAHGPRRGSKCGLQHHHLRQSAQRGSGRDHRRRRERFSLRSLREDCRPRESDRARHRAGAAARHCPDRRQGTRSLPGICRSHGAV